MDWGKVINGIVGGLLVFVVIAFFALFMAFPLKWTWNYVMPYLFEFKTITWGHAWCLSWIASSLIKSTLSSSK